MVVAPFVPTPVSREGLLTELLDLSASLRSDTDRRARERPTQDRLVVAFERLRGHHGITKAEFCEKLGIPERTFRCWRNREPSPPPPSPALPKPERPKRRDRKNRGKFDLAVVPPGVQVMADTSDLKLFDVPLKLISVQDPGNRGKEIWEAFSLDAAEDSRRVSETIITAVMKRPVLQVLTDQGTPYRSAETEARCDANDLEHVLAKEGAPTQKATLERSFGIVKSLLTPLVTLTSKLAAACPSLADSTIAATVGKYIVALALDAYRLGRDAQIGKAEPFGGDPEMVRAVVEEYVEKGREGHGSRRVELERIHEEYLMEGSRGDFVKALRHHSLEHIKEAERRLRDRACRCNARHCDRYYVGILRNVAEESRRQRAAERGQLKERHYRREEERKFEQEQSDLRNSPERSVLRGLKLIAKQWNQRTKSLFAGGRGIGHVDLRKGLHSLHERDGTTVFQDRSEVLWRQWTTGDGRDQPEAHATLRVLWSSLVEEELRVEGGYAPRLADRILKSPARSFTPRSPP